ncbi:helix-turn-helix domain-containing protein [Streptomyces asiaticus]|uniref:helix-turn-helix domain-containing protein n=1 Tax=Streptomyces asiaticus TaxID=114695 RepID=UPI00374CF6BD
MSRGCLVDVRSRTSWTRGWAEATEFRTRENSEQTFPSILVSQLRSVIGVQLRYRFRLYPSAGQRAALARAFGCGVDVPDRRGDRVSRR